MKKLKPYQYNVVSRFCEDIAKGLMLGVFLGQITFGSSLGFERIYITMFYFVMSLTMFYFAVYFSKEDKS